MSTEVDNDVDGLEVVHDDAAAAEAAWLVLDEDAAHDDGARPDDRSSRAEPGTPPRVAPPDADQPPGAGPPPRADDGPEISAVVEVQLRHLGYFAAAAVVLAIVGFVVLGNTEAGSSLSFTWPTVLVGALGASVNAARRVLRLGTEPLEDQRSVPERLAVLQLWLSPVIGAGFAGLVYSMFLAGILQGELFPAFACAAEPFTDYGSFSSCTPATNADAAMLIVWGFAAGFAERWVPNLLDRVIGDTDQDPSS